jgi:PBSX family phage terminase large subunit
MAILNYGPRIERFAMRPPELDKKINIMVGSVRSGKTWGLHSKILYLCDYPVSGRKLITGVSKASIKTNVLTDLFDIVGSRNFHYNSQSGELKLFKSEWLVYGAKDEGSEKYLRGATIGAAVCDEVVLMPESYFQMLLTRMSPHGARLYGSTNTDSPYHWLKTDYIDNAKLRDVLWYDYFTMADNITLDPSYVEDQKKLYTGVFYDRMILGKWASAAGAVYAGAWTDDNLYDDKTRPVGLYGQGGYSDHLIAVDYGTTNPCVFLDFIDDGRTLWGDNEYYWDSKKMNRQKTDDELAADLVDFIAASNCRQQPKIIIDPSAASFRVKCLQLGLWVVDCDNDVMSYGIRRTASALAAKKLRFHRQRVEQTPRELQNYLWDKKKAENGQEQVVKKNDHGPDATRYAVNEVFKDEWRLAA